ncbi:transcription activator BRG1-like isoform X3 [Dysidea avara]|uniref:transcription activator BRG1-like isoform X3 n=1 Tax=Dysidea avara TaxID=196820 RepID=UPI0033287F9D
MKEGTCLTRDKCQLSAHVILYIEPTIISVQYDANAVIDDAMLYCKALEDGTLEEVEEQVKTTKRKRKTKKDDGIDLANKRKKKSKGKANTVSPKLINTLTKLWESVVEYRDKLHSIAFKEQ